MSETLRENILTGIAAQLKAMLDEALEENEQLKKRLGEAESVCAATTWVKWNPESPLGPAEYEWCLWSIVTYGWRQCIYGYLERLDGRLILSWEGQPWEKYGRVVPDDTTWWARVNPLPQHQIDGGY